MSKKIQSVSSNFRVDNEIWFHKIRKLSFDFLNKHYDELQSAKRIANQGYISFLDPETGAIDAKNKDCSTL